MVIHGTLAGNVLALQNSDGSLRPSGQAFLTFIHDNFPPTSRPLSRHLRHQP